MSTSCYSYVGPMILIPEKNVDVEQRCCINSDCFKKGHVTDANFCPLCSERVGISINSVPVIDHYKWYMNWQDIQGIDRHIAGVALSENMTPDELHCAFEDFFTTIDNHIVHEKYCYKIDDFTGDDCVQFTPKSLSDMCDEYRNDDLVKLFIKVLSLALQENVDVFCGHKLYSL